MMDYSVNARRKYLGTNDGSGSDEEHLIDEEGYSDEPSYEPKENFYQSGLIKDRYNFGYVAFYLFGMLTLLPWNFLATANDYWMYKFRDVESNMSSGNKTELQTEFTSYLSIASTFPSLFFLVVSILCGNRISFHIRIYVCLTIMLLSFVLTTSLVYIDTDKWQKLFFALTLLIAVVMNISSGLLQASIWGIASKFPSKYIAAATSGQALGGIFAAIVNIASLAVSASSTVSAMMYFSIANVTVLTGLIFYKILSSTKFFKYNLLHKTPARALQYDPAEVNEVSSAFEAPNISLKRVLSKVSSYAISIGLCYTATLSLYPSLTVLIRSVNGKGDWQTKYFAPVVAFLVFSVWDYLGRILAGFFKWPIERERLVLGFSVFRFIFVPLFIMCNAEPRQYLPVLIDSDSAYIFLTCLLGYSNGYLTNIVMINYPGVINDAEKDTASSVITLCLALGCAVGSAISFLLIQML